MRAISLLTKQVRRVLDEKQLRVTSLPSVSLSFLRFYRLKREDLTHAEQHDRVV